MDMQDTNARNNYSAITETTLEIDVDANHSTADSHRQNEAYGYVLVFFSAVLFCIMFLGMRAATAYNGVSVSAVVFLRGLTQILLATSTSWTLLDARKIFFVPKDLLPLLAARGVFGALSLTLSYISISLVPLSLESTLFFTSTYSNIHHMHSYNARPLTIIYVRRSHIHRGFVSEPAFRTCRLPRGSRRRPLSVIGVGFVSNPTLSLGDVSSSGYVMGIATALGSAVLASVAHIAIRSLCMRVHFMTNVLAFAICEIFIGAAMGGVSSVISLTGNTRGFWITISACLFGLVAQCLFCHGLQHCRAGTGSIIRTVDVPLAYVLGLVSLGETSNFVAMFGSALVLARMIIIGWEAAMNNEKEPEKSELIINSNKNECEAK